MSVTAAISHISRGSLHDGPGVRTVVYFKGCGLRCRWCHNPETLSLRPEVLYTPQRCIGCGSCIAACPEHHVRTHGQIQFLRDGCLACGTCVEACPAGAISLCGEEMTLEDVFRQVLRDRSYYRHSGGGVTLSGGECLLQADFCAALLEQCRQAQIPGMIETALFVPWQQIEKVLPVCSGFFADFKIPDPQKHREYTGQDNARILENLEKLATAAPGRVTVRIPIIPGVNDNPADADLFAQCLSPFANALQGVELLRYNSLAESKYLQTGRTYTDFGQPQNPQQMQQACASLTQALQGKVRVFTAL